MNTAHTREAFIATEPAPSEPWETLEEEQDAANFGMWLFLVTEILFFGGMFLVYAVNRVNNPEGFLAGAKATAISLGTVNAVILLLSSLTMIMAVQGAAAGRRSLVWKCLAATAALGALFLAVKGFEYYGDLKEGLYPGAHFPIALRGAASFWGIYWVMTSVHAIHLTVGVVLVARLAWFMSRLTPLALPDLVTIALYWHFVDTVWIFLYPILYLPGRAG
ncbi:MAG: cytochrome c oxidase subunit 3 [Rhodomicrobium sp.]